MWFKKPLKCVFLGCKYPKDAVETIHYAMERYVYYDDKMAMLYVYRMSLRTLCFRCGNTFKGYTDKDLRGAMELYG